jgi:surface antigen
MRRLLTAILTLAATGLAAPATAAPAFAQAPHADASSDLARLNQQLDQAQARLTDLNNQVEHAQGELDALERKLADDQRKQQELGRQLAQLARVEYEAPTLSFSTVMEARSLDQLLTSIAQARLVAHKQQTLLGQAIQLRRQDEQARSQMAARLNEVKSARDGAAQVEQQTLGLRDKAADEVAGARAAALAAQAAATLAPAPAPAPVAVLAAAPPAPQPPGAVGTRAPMANHFAYGYCTWYVANKRYVPWYGNAIDWWPNAAAYGYPEGSTPMHGSIMVSRESPIGHVAYVESVNGDGSFVVSEMNWAGWNVVDFRTVRPGQVPVVGFIYGS